MPINDRCIFKEKSEEKIVREKVGTKVWPKMIQNESEQRMQGIDIEINKTTFTFKGRNDFNTNFIKFSSLYKLALRVNYFVAAVASLTKTQLFFSRSIRLIFILIIYRQICS